MNALSKNLKDLREEMGLSQSELSVELHFNQSTISKWESGKREPSIEVLIIISKFFKVSADYLLGLKDE